MQIVNHLGIGLTTFASIIPGILRQHGHLLLDSPQLGLKLLVIGHRSASNLVQGLAEISQLGAVQIGGILNQIVAVRAVDAAPMAIVFVLLAAVASSSFDIVVARTLAVLVALEALGAALVTLAGQAALVGKAVEVVGALIALLAHHSGTAVALAGVPVAGRVVAAHRIAETVLAAIARSDVEVAWLALTAILADYVGLALALAGDLVATGDALLILLCSSLVAAAPITASVGQGQGIAKVSWQTLIAVLSGRVVDTLQALAGSSIAVAHSIGIHITVAVAALAGLHGPKESRRIAEEAITTLFAAGAEVTDRTLCADHRVTIDLQTSSFIGARTALAVIGSASESIAVETLGALVAVIAVGVVLADAATRLRVTDIGMTVAVAGDTWHEGSSSGWAVTIARSAGLAKLSQVALRTGTLLDPGGRVAGCSTMRRLKLHIVQDGLALHRIRGPNLDSSQIGQNGEESTSRLARLPLVVVVFVQPESILLHSLVGNSVALGKDG